jgi:hypothetical protein
MQLIDGRRTAAFVDSDGGRFDATPLPWAEAVESGRTRQGCRMLWNALIQTFALADNAAPLAVAPQVLSC